MAWFRFRKPKQPTAAQPSIEGLKAMDWREFETLIAQAFRQHGYTVEKTGPGGPGDISLILRNGGRTEFVHCKQWKARQVHVATVREVWGLMAQHNAAAVKIVSIGTFATEAHEFAKGKAIELIDGEHLLKLVRDVKMPVPVSNAEPPSTPTPTTTPQVATSPACPRCGAAMYKRFNLQTNKMYWGCVKYPGCKGSVPL